MRINMKKKWILPKNTKRFDVVNLIGKELYEHSSLSLSKDSRIEFKKHLQDKDLISSGRSDEKTLDNVDHKIRTLKYFMYGYQQGDEFLISPLGNLLLSYIEDKEAVSKIFLTMLWNYQYPHPSFRGATNGFNIYPFRLIYKLLRDERLKNKIYTTDICLLIAYTRNINDKKYERLVQEILKLRELNNNELKKKITRSKNKNTILKVWYEWDGYGINYLCESGVMNYTKSDELICRLYHPKKDTSIKSTPRSIKKSYISLPTELENYCDKLLEKYPYDQKPSKVVDGKRLTSEIIKEIYNFFPIELLMEIKEEEALKYVELLALPQLIEEYSNNKSNSGESKRFEKTLKDAFNLFKNVEAIHKGQPGETDVECKFLGETTNIIFAVEARSTKEKLSVVAVTRLEEHRAKIRAKYTILVTPRYHPAVVQDIKKQDIVILTASTLSEYLYHCILNNYREIDYSELHGIILKNMGKDISQHISNLTIKKFGASLKK